VRQPLIASRAQTSNRQSNLFFTDDALQEKRVDKDDGECNLTENKGQASNPLTLQHDR
jgi:hypothetical protein